MTEYGKRGPGLQTEFNDADDISQIETLEFRVIRDIQENPARLNAPRCHACP